MPYVSLSWLSDHVDLKPGTDIKQLAADLVKVGLEEEQIHPAAVVGPLVVGKVLTLEAKEQSNGKVINYCRVDVGPHNDQPGTGKEASDLPSRGIICGAHNFGVGDLVVVSLPGAVLPGDFQISARKTYGHWSDGMICSERELGLGNDHDGIIVLTKKFPDLAQADKLPAPGQSVIPLLGLGEETLEINITPDRGYCFSMRGVAREYAHSTGQKLRDLGLESSLVQPLPPVSADGFPVEVDDQAPIYGVAGCDRFVTRIVSGVNAAAATPDWMVKRLEQAGMRSISLAVDATNYVMLDLGQPLHAYDLDQVAAPIVVRRAHPGEELITLDGATRNLDPQDLLISDSPRGEIGARALGIAGVMGGADTEVTAQTSNVLIEAAHFDSISVARSQRRHRLPSEAAKRNERGVDPQLAGVAAQRVVDILVRYGGGTDTGRVSEYNRVAPLAVVRMKLSEPARLIGVDYPTERVVGLLEEIGAKVEVQGEELLVTPPSWRPDLVGPAHLVEEIARLDGYDRIPSRIPKPRAGSGLTKAQKAKRDAARTLAEKGLVQVLSYPFVNQQVFDQQLLGAQDIRRQAVRLANPLANDAPLLRTSILDTLLGVAGRNLARGNTDFAIFESGLVTRGHGVQLSGTFSVQQRPADDQIRQLQGGVPLQPLHVAAVYVGYAQRPGVLGAGRKYDWADAIAAVQSLGATLGVTCEVKGQDVPGPLSAVALSGPAGDPLALAPFHPGRCARLVLRGKCVGLAGQLHPQVAKNFGLPADSCGFEVDLDRFIEAMPKKYFQVQPVSTFPAAKEDIALVVDQDLPAEQVQKLLVKQAGPLLEEVRLFDIYTGDQLPAGKKSLAFSLKLRSQQGTLTAQQITEVRNQILKAAAKKYRAELRS